MCNITDVLLLLDVTVNFKKNMSVKYDLEPLHFLTLPLFSSECALKITWVELELLTDINKILYYENGIRVGLLTRVIRH